MTNIIWSSKFKRDFLREFRNDKQIISLLVPVVADLSRGIPLDKKYRDHALSGDMRPCRDCHIKPDLVLIYSILPDGRLSLERLGSHSQLEL